MHTQQDDYEQAAYCRGWNDGRYTHRSIEQAERYASFQLGWVAGFGAALARRWDVLVYCLAIGWFVGRVW